MEAHMEVVKIVPEAAKVEILVPPVKPHVLIWKHTQSVMFMLCPCTHTARIQTSSTREHFSFGKQAIRCGHHMAAT